jgi:glucose/arabinose dehydrogenase
MSKQNMLLIFLTFVLVLASCGKKVKLPPDDGGGDGVTPPPAASVTSELQVASQFRSVPFNVARTLTVPPGFEISVYAKLETPRFMAVASNNDLLVSQPFRDDARRNQGKIILLRSTPSGLPEQYTFASGLTRAHDLVFHTIDDVTYLYIAETNRIQRCVYTPGQTALDTSTCQAIIENLPDARSGISRSYGHELKNLALDSNHNLYVSIASSCNACQEDTLTNPIRGAIYVYTADGKNARLFAQGLRNATGLAIYPGTNRLWVTVANRDDIRYPYQNDFDGDGINDYNTLVPAYTDNHPPDLLLNVKNNSNYGWPFCNANPGLTVQDFNYDNLLLERDVETNPDGSKLDCATAVPARKGILAHSTPLGLLFLKDTAFPEAYQQGVAIAYRGSAPEGRTEKSGYKIAYFPWNQKDKLAGPGDEIDLVTGFDQWLDPSGKALGRPVDVAVDKQGNMFITDDTAGAIYKLTYVGQ